MLDMMSLRNFSSGIPSATTQGHALKNGGPNSLVGDRKLSKGHRLDSLAKVSFASPFASPKHRGAGRGQRGHQFRDQAPVRNKRNLTAIQRKPQAEKLEALATPSLVGHEVSNAVPWSQNTAPSLGGRPVLEPLGLMPWQPALAQGTNPNHAVHLYPPPGVAMPRVVSPMAHGVVPMDPGLTWEHSRDAEGGEGTVLHTGHGAPQRSVETEPRVASPVVDVRSLSPHFEQTDWPPFEETPRAQSSTETLSPPTEPARSQTPVVVCQWEWVPFSPRLDHPPRSNTLLADSDSFNGVSPTSGSSKTAAGSEPSSPVQSLTEAEEVRRQALAALEKELDCPAVQFLKSQLTMEEEVCRIEIQGAAKVAWASLARAHEKVRSALLAMEGTVQVPQRTAAKPQPVVLKPSDAVQRPSLGEPSQSKPAGLDRRRDSSVSAASVLSGVPLPGRKWSDAPFVLCGEEQQSYASYTGVAKPAHGPVELRKAVSHQVARLEEAAWDARYDVQQEERQAWRFLMRQMDADRSQAMCRATKCPAAPPLCSPATNIMRTTQVPQHHDLVKVTKEDHLAGLMMVRNPPEMTLGRGTQGPKLEPLATAKEQEPPVSDPAPAPGVEMAEAVTAGPVHAAVSPLESTSAFTTLTPAAQPRAQPRRFPGPGPTFHNVPLNVSPEAAATRIRLEGQLQRLQAALGAPSAVQQTLMCEEEEEAERELIFGAESAGQQQLRATAQAIASVRTEAARVEAEQRAKWEAVVHSLCAEQADAAYHIASEELFDWEAAIGQFSRQLQELHEHERNMIAQEMARHYSLAMKALQEVEDEDRDGLEDSEILFRTTLREAGWLLETVAYEEVGRTQILQYEQAQASPMFEALQQWKTDICDKMAERLLEEELERTQKLHAVSNALDVQCHEDRLRIEQKEECERSDLLMEMEHEFEPIARKEARAAEERRVREERLLELALQLAEQERRQEAIQQAMTRTAAEEEQGRGLCDNEEAQVRDGLCAAFCAVLEQQRQRERERHERWMAAWAPRFAELDAQYGRAVHRTAREEQVQRNLLFDIMRERMPDPVLSEQVALAQMRQQLEEKVDRVGDELQALRAADAAKLRQHQAAQRAAFQRDVDKAREAICRAEAGARDGIQGWTAVVPAEAEGRAQVTAMEARGWSGLIEKGERVLRVVVCDAEAAAAAELYSALEFEKCKVAHRSLAHSVSRLQARIAGAASEELAVLEEEEEADRRYVQVLERRAWDALVPRRRPFFGP